MPSPGDRAKREASKYTPIYRRQCETEEDPIIVLVSPAAPCERRGETDHLSHDSSARLRFIPTTITTPPQSYRPLCNSADESIYCLHLRSPPAAVQGRQTKNQPRLAAGRRAEPMVREWIPWSLTPNGPQSAWLHGLHKACLYVLAGLDVPAFLAISLGA
ncbi:hypothetical protein J6590_031070 [Homalodisca vitripennis]|nr:hypothetical protein J6590_031070 [Homalodisca vitripennis]